MTTRRMSRKSITNSLNGRRRITLKDHITKAKFLNKQNRTPSCQGLKSKYWIGYKDFLCHSCNNLSKLIPNGHSNCPLHLYPQKWPHQSLPSQNPYQEVSIVVVVHEPSCWDIAELAGTPANDAVLCQPLDSTAKPLHQSATYFNDSKEPNKPSRKLQNFVRSRSPT